MEKLETSFSTLIMSIASSAAMHLGLVPQAQGGKIEKDLKVAQFNIDLLIMLEAKTKNNLNDEEAKLLRSFISDLQLRFVESK